MIHENDGKWEMSKIKVNVFIVPKGWRIIFSLKKNKTVL